MLSTIDEGQADCNKSPSWSLGRAWSCLLLELAQHTRVRHDWKKTQKKEFLPQVSPSECQR